MPGEYEQNVRFFDSTAPRYDELIGQTPEAVLAREVFQNLVTQHVPPGETLLDFGCGTGLDAAHYAGRGYRVLAYDNSPGMIEQLERRGADPHVTPLCFDYSEFDRRIEDWPRPSAAAANFAVLNHLRDPGAWFDVMARRLASPAWIVLSVLNPTHWTHVRTLRWWRNLLSSEPLPVRSPESCTIYLHSLPSLLRAARGFRLVGRANAGSLVRYDAGGQTTWYGNPSSLNRARRILWRTPVRALLGHFVFLVLKRDS